MNVIIHHNPRCSKSRTTLALLREHGIEPEIVRYLDDPPDPARLRQIAARLGVGPAEMVRTGESTWKELGLALDALDDESLLRILSEHPILIERPIVELGERARIGRPPEAVLDILQQRRR